MGSLEPSKKSRKGSEVIEPTHASAILVCVEVSWN